MYDLKIFTDDITPKALNQIYTLMAQLSFSKQKVRIMPDAHAGKGCVVGFTSTMTDKAIPNVIGVDIGCGMLTAEIGKADFSFQELDKFIRRAIPAGTGVRKTVDGQDLIEALYCYPELRDMNRLYGSIGSLGSGNHFIEVDADDEGNKYIVIHSGSRNLGQQVACIYQKKAIDICKNAASEKREQTINRLKEQGRIDEIPDALRAVNAEFEYKSKIPNELCYLDGLWLEKYMHDMRICQQFAKRNREKMMSDILAFLRITKADMFETVHNFIGDDNIIRKGAIPAYKGMKLLIPLNMRDGCLVCEGLGNEDWNFSAPHGAGRLLSRSDARELISLDEYRQSMQGIYTTSISQGTLDEAPMVYKPAEEIATLIAPTVEIKRTIKPVYNFKA